MVDTVVDVVLSRPKPSRLQNLEKFWATSEYVVGSKPTSNLAVTSVVTQLPATSTPIVSVATSTPYFAVTQPLVTTPVNAIIYSSTPTEQLAMYPGFLMGITSSHDFVPSNTIPDDSDDEDMFFYDAMVSLDDEILASFSTPKQNNVLDGDIFYDAQSTLHPTLNPTDLLSFFSSFLPSMLYTLFIGLIMSDFTCIFYSLFTLQILIRSLELFEVWWNNLIGLCLHDGVRQSHQFFAYP